VFPKRPESDAEETVEEGRTENLIGTAPGVLYRKPDEPKEQCSFELLDC